LTADLNDNHPTAYVGDRPGRFCLEDDCQAAEPLCHVKVSGFDSQLEQVKSFLCDGKVSALVSESEHDKSLLCDVRDKKRGNNDTVQKAWEDNG
jgi:hypothetical protein